MSKPIDFDHVSDSGHRALVGIMYKDESVRIIDVFRGGTPKGIGHILYLHYQNQEIVDNMIDLGDLLQLGTTLEQGSYGGHGRYQTVAFAREGDVGSVHDYSTVAPSSCDNWTEAVHTVNTNMNYGERRWLFLFRACDRVWLAFELDPGDPQLDVGAVPQLLFDTLTSRGVL
jgi:hypothetical protein